MTFIWVNLSFNRIACLFVFLHNYCIPVIHAVAVHVDDKTIPVLNIHNHKYGLILRCIVLAHPPIITLLRFDLAGLGSVLVFKFTKTVFFLMFVTLQIVIICAELHSNKI